MKRRKFFQLASLGFPTLCLPYPDFTNGQLSKYPFKTLDEAFSAIGFDTTIGDTFFVVAADVHYGSEGDGMMHIIDDINQMTAKPALLCINGDMIIHASRHFGVVPNEQERNIALDEFKRFKSDIENLDSNVDLKLVLGNHDTHPGEVDPALFWEVFPEYPAYQSVNVEGLHLFFLNGHSTGYIDPEQLLWLENEVNGISKSQEVVIFVHQPSMSHRVRERGIPAAIAKAFENHEGRTWLIGGHVHTNAEEVFKLSNTHLIQHSITCGTCCIWGGSEKPGYWLYCWRNGEVFGRIFKQRYNGYRIAPSPSIARTRNVPVPFDDCTNILYKYLVDTSEQENLIEYEAEDCLNFWAYVKCLVYRIHSKEVEGTATNLALLTEYKSQDRLKSGQYFMSSNTKDWEEMPLIGEGEEILFLSIPPDFHHSEIIFFKFTPFGEANVGGFALLE